MKKLLSLLISFVIAFNSAYATPTGPDISNTCGLSQPCGLLISQINVYLANTDWLKSRNAANSADINLLRADSSDDTNLNSDSGDFIYFTIGGDANRKYTWNASSDSAFTSTFGDGGTTATQILVSSASTADADDDSTWRLCGGGAYAADGSRGACISLPGEEVAGGGDIAYVAGAGDTHTFSAGSTTTMTIGATGDVAAVGQFTSTGLNFPAANFETVAGAGTTVADATAMSATKHIHQLTGANGTVGWKFPSATAGQVEILLNTTAGVPKIYAVSGGTCNGGAADAACTLVTGIVAHICYATAANAWICS